MWFAGGWVRDGGYGETVAFCLALYAAPLAAPSGWMGGGFNSNSVLDGARVECPAGRERETDR